MTPSNLTHTVRLDPKTAKRLKVFASEQGATMSGAVETLLDMAAAPLAADPETLWEGDPRLKERLERLARAADAVGDHATADAAEARLERLYGKGTK